MLFFLRGEDMPTNPRAIREDNPLKGKECAEQE